MIRCTAGHAGSCPFEFVVSSLSSGVSSLGGTQDRQLLLFNTFLICCVMVVSNPDGSAVGL